MQTSSFSISCIFNFSASFSPYINVNISYGVLFPKFFLGVELMCENIKLIFSCVKWLQSCPFGSISLIKCFQIWKFEYMDLLDYYKLCPFRLLLYSGSEFCILNNQYKFFLYNLFSFLFDNFLFTFLFNVRFVTPQSLNNPIFLCNCILFFHRTLFLGDLLKLYKLIDLFLLMGK